MDKNGGPGYSSSSFFSQRSSSSSSSSSTAQNTARRRRKNTDNSSKNSSGSSDGVASVSFVGLSDGSTVDEVWRSSKEEVTVNYEGNDDEEKGVVDV